MSGLCAERAKRAVGAKQALLALAAIAALVLVSQTAFADAAPVELVLTYLPHISTDGSHSASGIAELVLSEGEVRIQAADLDRLDGGQQYVAWLVNSHTNEFQKLGAFNTAASNGAVDYETVLNDSIPDKSWNLLLITIEGNADADHPSDKHSIAGSFPNTDNPLPEKLPNTGGAENTPQPNNPTAALQEHLDVLSQAEWIILSVLGALVLTVTFGAGYGLGRTKR